MLHPIAEVGRRVTAAARGLATSGDMACAAAPRNNLKSHEYLQADRLAAVWSRVPARVAADEALPHLQGWRF